jgi:hypothetical protein
MPARAQTPDPPRFMGNGFVITSGVGDQFGGVGLSISYDFALATALPFHIVPRMGIGALPEHATGSWGLTASYGYRHRLLVDSGVGAVRREELYLHGHKFDDHVVYAAVLAGGYEWVSYRGFVFRFTTGAGYKLGATAEYPRLVTVGSLGCGFKFQ